MYTLTTPELSVKDARALGICRICHRPIRWITLPEMFFDEDTPHAPVGLSEKGGKEFAHTACLPEESQA